MAAKRKASDMGAAAEDELVDPSDELAFYCLGGGNEVGRSCHIIQYKGKTVMVSLNFDGVVQSLADYSFLLSNYSLMQVCIQLKKASRPFPSLTNST